MAIPSFKKQPAEQLDYVIDLSGWLTGGDTIASAQATADTGLTLGSTFIDDTGTKVTQWISGGADGTNYHVQVLITTKSTPPRIKDVDFLIVCQEQ